MYQIAIDGPSGAGKSTLAKVLANRLNFVYVDTGAMYRTVGLYMLRKGIALSDTAAVIAALPDIEVSLSYPDGTQHILLNGEDVSTDIRVHEVSDAASKVSSIPQVRTFLLDLQHSMASRHNIIMDGRDIGTVIFPQAQVKIFLIADDETRAKRRCEELKQKGQDVPFETVLNDIRERDRRDREREVAPAVAADDAVILDNSGMTFDETVEAALAIIGRVIHD